jgi:hypothetical protein
MNELEAVQQLVQKTGTKFVVRGKYVVASDDLLQVLQHRFEHERWFFLDNGPRDNELGVYFIRKNGEINPNRIYAPVDLENEVGESRKYIGGTLRPSFTHFDFGD